MWTRDLLKMNAKQVLRNNYWMALLVAFVASLLAGLFQHRPHTDI